MRLFISSLIQSRAATATTMTVALACCLCLCAHSLRAQTLPDLPAIVLDGFDPESKEQIQKAVRQVEAKPRDAEANGWLGMTLHTYEQFEWATPLLSTGAPVSADRISLGILPGHRAGGTGATARSCGELSGLRCNKMPKHLPAQLRLAEALLAGGQLSESQQFYEIVIKRNPNIAQAYYGLGRVFATSKPAEALRHYRRAIELFPEYGAAHYALGLALRDAGQTAEAQEHLARSQQLKLSRPTLEDPLIVGLAEMNAGASKHLKRGALLEREGKLEASIAEHEQALELNPWFIQAHINLISLYGRTSQFDKAEKHYHEPLSRSIPTCPTSITTTASCWLDRSGSTKPRKPFNAVWNLIHIMPKHITIMPCWSNKQANWTRPPSIIAKPSKTNPATVQRISFSAGFW